MATDTTYQLSVQAWFAETPGAAHHTSAAFKGVLRTPRLGLAYLGEVRY